MKSKNAFTLIELMIVIIIVTILASVFIPAVALVKKKAQPQRREQTTERYTPKFTEGETVAIEGMDATGKVNAVSLNGKFDILIKDENGKFQNLEGINGNLLRKVRTSLRD